MEQLDQIDIKQAAMGGFLVAVVYYLLLFNDGKQLKAQISQVDQEIKVQTQTKQKIQSAISERERFEQEAEEINTNLKTFLSYFPPNANQNQVMKKVSQYAEKNKITIVSLKPIDKVAEFQDYPEMAFEFEIEGTFHQLMQFISDLTQMKRAIDFGKMKLKVATRGEVPTVKLSSTLITYSYAAKAQGGK